MRSESQHYEAPTNRTIRSTIASHFVFAAMLRANAPIDPGQLSPERSAKYWNFFYIVGLTGSAYSLLCRFVLAEAVKTPVRHSSQQQHGETTKKREKLQAT